MSTTTMIILVIAILAIAGAAFLYFQRRRTEQLHGHFGRRVQHKGRTILESDAPDLADAAGVVFSTPKQDDPGQATPDDGDRHHAQMLFVR